MIHFNFENIEEVAIGEDTKQWLTELITAENRKPGSIEYIFCDDEYLLEINRKFLQHDYYTDTITFNYVKGKTISGDIFVSLPRIFENAQNLITSTDKELHRVLAHGILHLIGYNDKTEEEIKEMRAKEDYYLELKFGKN